jgi:hypothetical protein
MSRVEKIPLTSGTSSACDNPIDDNSANKKGKPTTP